MKATLLSSILIASLATLWLVASALGAEQLANVDRRREGLAPPAELSPQRAAAVAQLQSRIPSIQVHLDEILSSPKFIYNPEGFLSAPDNEEEARPPQTVAMRAVKHAAAAEAADPNRSIKRFLDENSALFGYDSSILAASRVRREYPTEHNGVRTVIWEQRLDGIPVFEAVLYGHISKIGELVSLCSQFIPDPAHAADQGVPNRLAVQLNPPISAIQAVASAASYIGEDVPLESVTPLGPVSDGPEREQKYAAPSLREGAIASLIWLPMNRERMRLSWWVILESETRRELFQVLVDALTAEPQIRHSLTFRFSDVSYLVYTSDSPSPFTPGLSTPGSFQPPLVPQAPRLESNVRSAIASPNGWIGPGEVRTLGNNVDARLDVQDSVQRTYNADDNFPDQARPSGAVIGGPSGTLTFAFTTDFNQFPNPRPQTPSASVNQKAAVVNAFYWCNWMHDRLYGLGFTEPAGNFQQDNFGRGGVGGDAVLVDVQNGEVNNSGGFGALPEGNTIKPMLQIGLSHNTTRDVALQTGTLLHEYTHGLSMRRVGGGVGITVPVTQGLGEGWSDFYAQALLSEPTDDVDGTYGQSGYTYYQFLIPPSGPLFTENYYYGSRRYPYSTDTNKSPLTFKDIDVPQSTLHEGVPRSPVYPPDLDNPWDPFADEVHARGEVWCVTLWDARANLIRKLGFAIGNELMLQLVTDGMNFSPPNPNFLEARDAILLADRVKTGGANLNELWAAFAKRGMGYHATAPPSSSSAVHEEFDLPPQGPQALTFTAGNAVYSSAAIGPDGTVYIGSDDGRIYALDPATLQKRWEFYEPWSPPQNFRTAPVVGPDGVIYARRANGYLYAIYWDGTRKWRTFIDSDAWSSVAIGRDGTLYVPGYTTFYAISPQDGHVLWPFATGNTLYSSPAVAPDGTIYFGGMDAKLYALDPATHTSKPGWPKTLGDWTESSPAVGADGSVYIGCNDGKLYAFYPNGTAKWTASLAGPVDSSPTIGPDGSIYVGSQPYHLYSINPNTGQVNSGWPYLTSSFVTTSFIRSTPAVAADGTIYMGGDEGKIHAVQPNGAAKQGAWPYYLAGSVLSSPTIGPDGKVYFGSANSKVYALGGLSGLARTSWPMFRREPRHFANQASIQLHSGVRWPSGVFPAASPPSAFQFSITASPSVAAVSIDASSDLVTWASLGSVALPGGSTNYVEPFAFDQRFYRVSVAASGHRSFNPYGYITRLIAPGWTLIANQLYGTNHYVRALFSGSPDGTFIRKVNEATGVEEQATFSGGVWTGPNFLLRPGEAAIFYNPTTSSLKVTFIGEVLQGNLVSLVPAGSSRRSSMVPQSGRVQSDLQFPVGIDAVGVWNLNPSGGWDSFAYDPDASAWFPYEPSFSVGYGFLIDNPAGQKNWVRNFSVW